MRKAIRIALTGRPGPVHLDLPSDILKTEIPHDTLPPKRYRPVTASAGDTALLDRAADLLAGARKPALLVGGGAVAAGAHDAVLSIAEHLGAPVATSLRGKGIISEDHPLSLGCLGIYGTRMANTFMRSGVDVLLAVGVSFHELTTHCWDPSFQPTSTLIQIDVDPHEMGKNYPVDVAIVADARRACEGIVSRLQAGDASAERTHVSKSLPDSHWRDPASESNAFPLKPQRIVADLRAALPDNAVVFTDIGNSLTWTERDFTVRRPGLIVGMTGLAAMGSGVAGAIGGKLATPDRPVVCVCGDGDFQMTGLEALTAAQYQVPLVWLVMNNSRLGMIHDIQELSYQGRTEASEFTSPDYVGLAAAMGVDGRRVGSAGELVDAIRQAVDSGRPTIIDVPTDPSELPPMRPRMLALSRTIGLPDTHRSISWQSAKALAKMVVRRES